MTTIINTLLAATVGLNFGMWQQDLHAGLVAFLLSTVLITWSERPLQ